METMYGLIRVETEGIPKEEQVREVIFVSENYVDCLGKFLSKSSFSFMNNNKYSYTHYFIEEVVKVCGSCDTPLGPNQLIGDDVLTICDECGATEDYVYREDTELQELINKNK